MEESIALIQGRTQHVFQLGDFFIFDKLLDEFSLELDKIFFIFFSWEGSVPIWLLFAGFLISFLAVFFKLV